MEKRLEYGLIGAKLRHSFSPEIHARIGHYPCWKNAVFAA